MDDIISHRTTQSGKREYLVKWSGYTSIHNSWEPVDNLVNAKDIINEYHKKQRLQSIDDSLKSYMKRTRRQHNIQSMASSINCVTNLPHLMLCLSLRY